VEIEAVGAKFIYYLALQHFLIKKPGKDEFKS
jgi:hypothetical protein